MWGTGSRSWNIVTRAEKDAVLEGVREIAADVDCHPRVLDLLISAVDEMIINALKVSKEEQNIAIECGSDGRLLAVSVLDECGSFLHEDLFQGIGMALQHDEKGLPPEHTHAHLGFRIMLEALSQVAINVDPGVCTEVIGIVDLRRSLREHRKAIPNLGMFRKTD